MEILIQTKKSIWSISSNGISKVSTWDWEKAKEAFNIFFIQQNEKLKEAIISKSPMGAAIEESVRKGVISAEKNAAAWRKIDDNRLP